VREVATQLGQLMQKPVEFSGVESPDALLSNGQRGYDLLGCPQVNADTLIRWTADWIGQGGATLGKPTKFQNREGDF